MSDAPELQCERDDCGRYFEVDNPNRDAVRCPHCGYERAVPDDLPDREQSPASSGPARGGGQGQAAVDVATEDGTLQLEVHVHVHHHG